jgi:ankyrin repeat protein
LFTACKKIINRPTEEPTDRNAWLGTMSQREISSCLFLAATSCEFREEVCQSIFNTGVVRNRDIEKALQYSCDSNLAKTAHFLAAKCISLSEPTQFSDSLADACVQGRFKIIDILVNVMKLDKCCSNEWRMATGSGCGNIELMRQLAALLGESHTLAMSRSLRVACYTGQYRAVKWLLTNTAASSASQGVVWSGLGDMSAVISACYSTNNKMAIIMQLLRTVTPHTLSNSRNVSHNTAFHLIIGRYMGDAFRSPHSAVAADDLDAVNHYLYTHDVDEQDNDGQTPLHVACMLGNEEMVITLLSVFARTDITDDSRRTPEQVVREYNNDHLLLYLFYPRDEPGGVTVGGGGRMVIKKITRYNDFEMNLKVTSSNDMNLDQSESLPSNAVRPLQELVGIDVSRSYSVMKQSNENQTTKTRKNENEENILIQLWEARQTDWHLFFQQSGNAFNRFLYQVFCNKNLPLSLIKMSKTDEEGYNCLHWAAASGNITLFQLLHSSINEVEFVFDWLMLSTNNNENVLHITTRKQHKGLLKVLLDWVKKYHINQSVIDDLLDITARNGDCCSLNVIANTLGTPSRSQMEVAFENHHYKYVEILVTKHGLDPDYALALTLDYYRHKLYKSTSKDFSLELENLVLKLVRLTNCNAELTNSGGNCIHWLSMFGQTSSLNKLLAVLAKKSQLLAYSMVETTGCRYDPIVCRHDAIVLVQGVHKTSEYPHYCHGWCCLRVKRDCIPMLESKISSRPIDLNFDFRDREFVDLLQFGSVLRYGTGLCNDREAKQHLLDAAHDAYNNNESYDRDLTPLHLAIATQRYDNAKVLIEFGADVNAYDFNGQTPLHYAAVAGNANMCELLVKYGADIDAKDNNGKTAKDMASFTIEE